MCSGEIVTPKEVNFSSRAPMPLEGTHRTPTVLLQIHYLHFQSFITFKNVNTLKRSFHVQCQGCENTRINQGQEIKCSSRAPMRNTQHSQECSYGSIPLSAFEEFDCL